MPFVSQAQEQKFRDLVKAGKMKQPCMTSG